MRCADMENQHRQIAGYRELTQIEIDLMNRVKEQGPALCQLCDDIYAYLENQAGRIDTEAEHSRLIDANPEMWLYKGSASLQEGLMFLTRAVAQPTFF